MSRVEQGTYLLAAQAVVTAGELAIGAYVAQISVALLLLGLLPGLFDYPVSGTFLLAAIALALVQGYFAVRVRFDASIFRTWAERWYGNADPKADLDAFDRQIGRKATPAADIEADMTNRRHGALRLLRLQIASLVLQVLMTVIALWP